MIGTKLAHYEITSHLGSGGMGDVYQATDAKLGRSVAIKFLPEAFSHDGERVARFQREARVLASLNHPNIAAIHGLEEIESRHFLVMELVSGETLAERIQRGAIPVSEALPIAKQIAEALEAAHDQGFIHRDLKPANIKVRPDGTVKVLDFGLAKALESSPTNPTLSNSPTLSMAATHVGVVLGTAAYMSPEQAGGKAVDKRSDIWAFGVVLYEMLTGRRAFKGDDISEIFAALLRDTPALDALPAETPPEVRRVLARCLERDSKERLRDIGEARVVLARRADEATRVTGLTAPGRPRPRLLTVLPWVVSAAAITALAWTLWGGAGSTAAPRAVSYVDVTFPPGVEPVSGNSAGFAISPDGQTVAMIGVRAGVRRLFVRRLDRPEAAEIAGTDGTNGAAFSPDSASVAAVLGSGVLTRFSLVDQQRTPIASGADVAGVVTWGNDGILYNRGGTLWIASPQGGKARQLTTLDAARHEVMHGDALALPGGHTVLFASLTTDVGTERIEAVRVDSGRRSVLVDRAIAPAYAPTGHLLFGRDGAVLAVSFDIGSAAVRGPALPIMPAGTIRTVRAGSLGFQVSTSGTLVFAPTGFATKHLVSVGRDGSVIAVDPANGPYANPRISPDGHRLIMENGGSLIEMLDLLRGTRTRVTAAALGTQYPTWTADGEAVVFKRFNLPFWEATDGTGKTGPVAGGLVNDFPSSPGPTADSFFAVRIQPETSGDIFLMSKSGSFPPRSLVVTPAYEGGPQLSPDGRWLLYQSDASGQPEIYVRRFPALDRQWPVSEGGGVQTRWSPTDREIYYRNGRSLMAVPFDASGAEPVFGKPAALFPDEYEMGANISVANYDITRDGRFIMLSRGPQSGTLRVVINWTVELQQLLAAGGGR
jgi:eukaryotic-like serine/threonine-protein kinase